MKDYKSSLIRLVVGSRLNFLALSDDNICEMFLIGESH